VQTFRLLPYPASDLPKIAITGEIERMENQLSIRYDVTGEIDSILLPTPVNFPSREDDLWKATCFEFFIAIKDQPRYLEFNMSPSGDWNVYAMDAYRRIGFREETTIHQLPFEFKPLSASLSLDLSVDLTPLIHLQQKIQLGITAIIQTRNGNETYWALAHPGPNADFHLRESFVIKL
jgi:hypothetical protein